MNDNKIEIRKKKKKKAPTFFFDPNWIQENWKSLLYTRFF